MIEDAIERESWTRQQWEAWHAEKLELMLHHAVTHVPFYQKYWQVQRRNGSKVSWKYLENWPVLEKERVRNSPQAFISDNIRVRNLYVDQTSGTTGRPTLIYESRETVQKWFALFEARIRRWYNVSYKQRWAIFGGQKVVPLDKKSPPFWVHNLGLNQLYFSVFHISSDTAINYVEALNRFSPTHLIVYPSSLSVLANHVLEQNLKPPKMQVIFSNSEKLLPHQKELIEQAFHSPVVDTYGMTELVSGASECAYGAMHFWPEMGIIELLDHQTKEFIQSDHRSGEFIFTGLFNEDMPLIRYRNGDAGYLPTWDCSCECGKGLPKFGEIFGRQNDLIVTPDGRDLYLLDSLFNGFPIVEVQVIQEAIDKLHLLVVPEKLYQTNVHDAAMINRMQAYVGKTVRVKVELVDCISRNGNGKFKPYLSLVGK